MSRMDLRLRMTDAAAAVRLRSPVSTRSYTLSELILLAYGFAQHEPGDGFVAFLAGLEARSQLMQSSRRSSVLVRTPSIRPTNGAH